MAISVARRDTVPIFFDGDFMPLLLRQEYMICYDIQNNKKRSKVYNELEKIGLKAVQKSVFWGYLTNAEITSIYCFIKQLVDEEDRILLTKTNFNGRGFSHLIGHCPEDFKDWDETCVI